MKTILQTMDDPKLFRATFKEGVLRDSWRAWRVFLSALFGLVMGAEALKIFRKHTGRVDAPAKAFHEAYVIAGRRAGKSIISALVATFLAAFRDYTSVLAPGEVGTLMVIAADRRQARVIFGYIDALFQTPLLARLVVKRTKEAIELSNCTRIEIHTCSFKATRGYTLVGVIADEVAFWRTEDSANPDVEVLNALRPGLATTGGLLLCISSPYSKRGALYAAFRDHYGKPSDVLVWKASSREMNPSLSAAVVALAYERDAAAARAEFGGEFRDDIEGFLTVEVVESRIVRDRRELPPLDSVSYVAFVDPSGGQADSMTLAIAHAEKDCLVLDLLRERVAPFNPEQVTQEFAADLKRYRCHTVTGDRYAGEWPREQFAKRGIEYRPSEKNRSEIYLEVLPLFMTGTIELLDNRKLLAQFVGLERRTARQGRDSIDHAVGAHDDLCNCVAGVLVLVSAQAGGELGVVELLKELDAGKNPELLYAHPMQARCTDIEKQNVCPQCGAAPLQDIGGGFRQCQNGGCQIAPPDFTPAVSITRGKYLEQRDARRAGLSWNIKGPRAWGFGRFGR